jgi:hypothetical protein
MNLADYIVAKYSVEKEWDESEHPRDEHGRFGEGGHDEERAQARRDEQQAVRSARAHASHNPLTKEKERLSNESEEHLSKALGLPRTGDNKPFDLQSKRVGVEVKTLVDQKAGKLTVHPESRAEKLRVAEKHGLRTYMVAVDKRGDQHRYYARAGIGSYTLKSMKEFPTMEALKRYVR